MIFLLRYFGRSNGEMPDFLNEVIRLSIVSYAMPDILAMMPDIVTIMPDVVAMMPDILAMLYRFSFMSDTLRRKARHSV